MSRVYLDASCIIYVIESASPFHEKVVSRLDRYRAAPEAAARTAPTHIRDDG